MDSPQQTSGHDPASDLWGWGVDVEVTVAGSRRGRWKKVWKRLTKPGKEEPLCTSLAGARAWAREYERLGHRTRLVEIRQPRGPSGRTSPAPAPVIKSQLALF